ncbi:MAG: hypothetical protein ABIP81_00245 [Terriglobales bacterium]
MRLARNLHLYFGVFFAPAFIFFAFSGMLQTFSLHEGKDPRPWIVAIEQIHTHQRMPGPLGAPLVAPTTSSTPPTAAPATSPAQTPAVSTAATNAPAAATAQPVTQAPAPAPPRRKRSTPMRIFVTFMGVALIGSSLVGVWMGFQLRKPAFIWTLLIAGTIIPFAALYIGTRP